ncbi:MAG: CBASS cGAMP-activated phospholipase [Pseudomonadota bacterium]
MTTRLLAIDGGGIRGVYAAHVLGRMQEAFSTESDLFVFHDQFDLIAGTSTGSIIAAALAFGKPISDVKELYLKHGAQIFTPRGGTFGGMLAPKYSSDVLRGLLSDVFEDARLGDAKTRLVIPATDIANGGVHVFKSGYDKSFVRDNNVRVADAVLASCSAPLYFEPAMVGEYQLCDGGLWANNPSLVALTEAMTRLGVTRETIRLVSVGTGIGHKYYSIKKSPWSWGFLLGWKPKKFIEMLLNLQSANAGNITKLILGDRQHVSVNFESNAPLSLDDPRIMKDLMAWAGRDFTHNALKIKALMEE